MLLTAKLVVFLCSVISQGKVVALDRWGGKWNHLSMTHRLTTNYAKNYCNRTLIVKVIVETRKGSHMFIIGTQCSEGCLLKFEDYGVTHPLWKIPGYATERTEGSRITLTDRSSLLCSYNIVKKKQKMTVLDCLTWIQCEGFTKCRHTQINIIGLQCKWK